MVRGTAAAVAATMLLAQVGLAQSVSVLVQKPGDKDVKGGKPAVIDQKSGARGNASGEKRATVPSKAVETGRGAGQGMKGEAAKPTKVEALPQTGAASPGLRQTPATESRRPLGVGDKAPFAGHWQGREEHAGGPSRGSDTVHERRDEPRVEAWGGGRSERGGIDLSGFVQIVLGSGEACRDGRRYEAPRPVFCAPRVTTLCEEVSIDGRRVKAEVTLWFERGCNDLKARVKLTTCDPRGLSGLSMNLEANQGRKNRWTPELVRAQDCGRDSVEFVTVGAPCWEVDCMQVRVSLATHCDQEQIEWRGVRVPS